MNRERDEMLKEIENNFNDLSIEAQMLVGKVIKIEKSKIHMGSPYGVIEEILKSIDEIVE